MVVVMSVPGLPVVIKAGPAAPRVPGLGRGGFHGSPCQATRHLHHHASLGDPHISLRMQEQCSTWARGVLVGTDQRKELSH